MTRRIGQHGFPIERGSSLVLTKDIVDRETVRGRLNITHIELVKLLDMLKHVTKLRLEGGNFGRLQLYPSQLGYISQIEFCRAHREGLTNRMP